MENIKYKINTIKEQKKNKLKQQTEILNQKKEIDSIKNLEQNRKNDLYFFYTRSP